VYIACKYRNRSKSGSPKVIEEQLDEESILKQSQDDEKLHYNDILSIGLYSPSNRINESLKL
jgi:hypothetical protein